MVLWGTREERDKREGRDEGGGWVGGMSSIISGPTLAPYTLVL